MLAYAQASFLVDLILPLLTTCKRICDQGRFHLSTAHALDRFATSPAICPSIWPTLLESLQDQSLVMPKSVCLNCDKNQKLSIHFPESSILNLPSWKSNLLKCFWGQTIESLSAIIWETLFATDENGRIFLIQNLVIWFKLQKAFSIINLHNIQPHALSRSHNENLRSVFSRYPIYSRNHNAELLSDRL